MNEKIIKVIDFSKNPYGRYLSDSNCSGQGFRIEVLAPAMRAYDKVHVDLDGYNRYGRSFLDEAFGGLIREEGFTKEELDLKLTYSHSLVKSIELVISERILAAHIATSEHK